MRHLIFQDIILHDIQTFDDGKVPAAARGAAWRLLMLSGRAHIRVGGAKSVRGENPFFGIDGITEAFGFSRLLGFISFFWDAVGGSSSRLSYRLFIEN
jgi:hypothetical protein